jgi:hypothetical protein
MASFFTTLQHEHLTSGLLIMLSGTFGYACDSTCTVESNALPQLQATIQIPDHALDAFDVSWFDQGTQRFYLADRANAGIEIIDAQSLQYVRRIAGFAGGADHDRSGPNGVLVIAQTHQLWAGDGDSTVKVIDLVTDERASISTGGGARADELSFDADDQVLLVVNNTEEQTDDPQSGAFATLISTTPDHAIRAKIVFHEASAGLEQSVWDPHSGMFYLAVPELDGDPSRGAIAVIDPKTGSLKDMYPVSECEPAGLALGPDPQLLVGCSGDAIAAGYASKTLLLNARDGSVIRSFSEVGGSDEVWFNAGDGNYYLAARDNPDGPVLGVIDSVSTTWRGNTKTSDDSKSVAANSMNNQVFVGMTPTADAFANDPGLGLQCDRGCIGVFAAPLNCPRQR